MTLATCHPVPPLPFPQRLAAAGIHLYVTPDLAFKYHAPSGAFTAELRRAFAARRDELHQLYAALHVQAQVAALLATPGVAQDGVWLEWCSDQVEQAAELIPALRLYRAQVAAWVAAWQSGPPPEPDYWCRGHPLRPRPPHPRPGWICWACHPPIPALYLAEPQLVLPRVAA